MPEEKAMTSITPFEFEAHQVRIVEIDGEPWFVAKDVAEVLGYARPRDAVADHCKGAAKHRLPTPGGMQVVAVIPERDVYRLIIRSNLPEAERFEEWVVGEVLPSIRKTGSYTHQRKELAQDLNSTVSALLLIGDAMKKVTGVTEGVAMACSLSLIEEVTGISMETARKALPAKQGPVFDLNASGLGKLAGMSGQAMNLALAGAGLQFKNAAGEWELADPGKKFAEAKPFNRHGHTGYQILWNRGVLGALGINESQQVA